MRTLRNVIDQVASIVDGALRVADVTGVGVELSNRAENLVIISVGALTDGTHTPKLQESDTLGSGYTDVAAADQDGALVALVANTDQVAGYTGIKKFVRVFVTVTGSPGTGAYYSALVVRGGARKRP